MDLRGYFYGLLMHWRENTIGMDLLITNLIWTVKMRWLPWNHWEIFNFSILRADRGKHLGLELRERGPWDIEWGLSEDLECPGFPESSKATKGVYFHCLKLQASLHFKTVHTPPHGKSFIKQCCCFFLLDLFSGHSWTLGPYVNPNQLPRWHEWQRICLPLQET